MKIYADDLLTELRARDIEAELWHAGGGIWLLGIGEFDEVGQPRLSLGPNAGADELGEDAQGFMNLRIWFDTHELFLGPPHDEGPNTYTVHPGADLKDLVELIATDPRVRPPRPQKSFEIREATGLRADSYRWELVITDQHIQTVHGLTPDELSQLVVTVEAWADDPNA